MRVIRAGPCTGITIYGILSAQSVAENRPLVQRTGGRQQVALGLP